MRLWHRHVWREYERAWAPPCGSFKASTCSNYLAERIMFGVTTIVFRCECGEIKTVETLGAIQAVAPLEKMVKP